MPTRLAFYPKYDALYYGYYRLGFDLAIQPQVTRLSIDGFPKLHQHCLALFLESDGKARRIYISAGDGTGVNKEGLAWCDIYAKVNVDLSTVPAELAFKIFPIGPSFGIRCFTASRALVETFKSILVGGSQIENRREHIANYYRQWRYRLPIDAYEPAPADNDYVFFVASLWKKEAQNNSWRANFIQACSTNPKIQFEGGFAPRMDMLEYQHLFIPCKYEFPEYLQRVKRSVVVFNTPAVANCLGWKLGEYCALGKAIISTPLSHPMPIDMVHGKNIHFVDGSIDSIHSAINLLKTDSAYRRKLESGAREYYLQYLQPKRVIERILEKLETRFGPPK